MAVVRKSNEPLKPKRRPATSPEARENQLVSLAVDLAEEQLLNGTASAQVVTHYLKLGTEREKLMRENELLKAKVEAVASAGRIEELYRDALNAMRSYGGSDDRHDD